MLCGDEEGSVWIYDVRHILAQPLPLPATPQAPIQVSTACSPGPGPGVAGTQHLSSLQILRWPQPWALGQVVTRTMVNTVVANSAFTYLTALTDSNIVAIWRRL